MIKLTELKLNKVRKIIAIDLNGEEKTITIYNPIGKQRKDLMDKIRELSSNKDMNEYDKKNELYKMVLGKLTDLKVNTKKFEDIENSPNKAFMEVNNEVMDIIHELQLEYLYEAKRGLNEQVIKTLTLLNLKKTKELTDLMNEVL
ncbi:MAG: hypothetical protein ACRCX2_36095 [Paraclostridium sp.]